MFDFDLFVIGGGSAGVRCARVAAGHGARVGIAEDRFWGGTCVNVGCVPKKLLMQAGEYGQWAADARGFGWRASQAGPHDWAALIAAKDREIDRLQSVYRRLLQGAAVTIFDARAAFVDPHRLRVGASVVTAERIVVATGGYPVRPDIPGAALGIVSDQAFHLPMLPRRVTLVGGGYIAVEFASIFANLGAEVDLIIRQSLPLRGFDDDLRAALVESLTAQRIRLHCGTTVHSLIKASGTEASGTKASGGARQVMLANGHAFETDLVFFATGRRPNIDGLDLAQAGITPTLVGAIPIDAAWRTVVPHIYAIGDVTDRLNLTPVATAEGHALADTLFGQRARAVSLDTVATAVFTTPPLASCGQTEGAAALHRETDIYLSRFRPMRHTISGRDRHALLKLVVDAATDTVVGAHMMGEDAPEIMQGLAIAIGMGAKKADFDRTIGIHPTAAEEFVTMRTRTRRVGSARTSLSA